MTRRLVQLYAGPALYGVSLAFFVQGRLGVMPWDVLHQGLTRWLPVSLGVMTIVVAVVVLLAWIPLRRRPGLGMGSNVVVIGLAVSSKPDAPSRRDHSIRRARPGLARLRNAWRIA